jgi:hypothetical protein
MSALADWARFPEDDLAPASTLRVRVHFGKEPRIGASAAALVYLLSGVLIVPRYAEFGDVLARIADGFYVLFSRDPHLAAIGFIWPPLPSLLAMPLIALKNVWPGLVQDGVALNIISAIFGGLCVFFMLRMLRRLDLPGPVRWVTALLFAFNPFVGYFASNGMTDLMMVATLLGAVDGLWAYLAEGYSARMLALSGVWLAIGYLIRYDVVAWALAVALALAVGLARLPRHERPTLSYWHWLGGVLVVWLTPLFYVVALWSFLNWSIMHDPFYFKHGGDYGNDAVTATGAYGWPPLDGTRGNIMATLAMVARQTQLFPPIVIGTLGLLAFGLLGRHERHARALVVVAASLGVPLLHVLMVYEGIDPFWLRFFLTFIPFGFVTVAYVAGLITARGMPLGRARWRRVLIWTVCIVGLAAGDYMSANELLVRSPYSRVELLTAPFNRMTGGDRVISYLNAYLDPHPKFTVLADNFAGAFAIIISLHHPERVVTTSDRDFKRIVSHPIGNVDAVLVPEPIGTAKLDAVNQAYPSFWEHGAPWAHLIADFPAGMHFRLYAIGRQSAVDRPRHIREGSASHPRPRSTLRRATQACCTRTAGLPSTRR